MQARARGAVLNPGSRGREDAMDLLLHLLSLDPGPSRPIKAQKASFTYHRLEARAREDRVIVTRLREG